MTDFAALRLRMVDNQLRTREVTDREVIRAFSTVPREKFAAPHFPSPVAACLRRFALRSPNSGIDASMPGDI